MNLRDRLEARRDKRKAKRDKRKADHALAKAELARSVSQLGETISQLRKPGEVKRRQAIRRSRVTFRQVEYLGGHPNLSAPSLLSTLFVDNIGFHAPGFMTKDLFLIPWSEIVGVLVTGSENVQTRVSATRLLTIGLFAFAAKKKSGATYVEVRTDTYTCGFEIDKTGADEVRGRITRWTHQLPPLEGAPPPSSPEPMVVTAPISISDELGKLAALRDQGVLTEDEFAQQKSRWLSL